MALRRVNLELSNLSRVFARASMGNAQQNILFVGAYCEDGVLSTIDKCHLSQAVMWMSDHFDMALSSSPTIDVCNLDYGSNFFALDVSDHKDVEGYDIIILSNLLMMDEDDYNEYQASTSTPNPLFRQSEFAFDGLNWHHAIQSIAPQLLINLHMKRTPCGFKINDLIGETMRVVEDDDIWTQYDRLYGVEEKDWMVTAFEPLGVDHEFG